MARIILFLSGVIIVILYIPMYFLLRLWVTIFEEYERQRRKEKEGEYEQTRTE